MGKLKHSKVLKDWYLDNSRPLPWRKTKRPYNIWISEVMLQQTTSTSVIDYYNRFIKRFPDLESLAKSKIEEVYEQWSGLGYYSRARNLHKSANILFETGFPKKWKELIKLPGFGPYTSRSVSSLAFNEPVGVLDGNVIRFFSRFYGLKKEWWKAHPRNEFQSLSDRWVRGHSSSELNQALMEIGAIICTPKNPQCFLCPVRKNCIANNEGIQDQLPLSKPKKQKQVIIWKCFYLKRKNNIALVENNYAPFLKNQLILPGQIQASKKSPKEFEFKHNITHYEIYVKKAKPISTLSFRYKWHRKDRISLVSPSSLIQKAIHAFET